MQEADYPFEQCGMPCDIQAKGRVLCSKMRNQITSLESDASICKIGQKFRKPGNEQFGCQVFFDSGVVVLGLQKDSSKLTEICFL